MKFWFIQLKDGLRGELARCFEGLAANLLHVQYHKINFASIKCSARPLPSQNYQLIRHVSMGVYLACRYYNLYIHLTKNLRGLQPDLLDTMIVCSCSF